MDTRTSRTTGPLVAPAIFAAGLLATVSLVGGASASTASGMMAPARTTLGTPAAAPPQSPATARPTAIAIPNHGRPQAEAEAEANDGATGAADAGSATAPGPETPAAWIADALTRHAGEVLARVRIESPDQLDALGRAGGDQWTHGRAPGWHDFRLDPAARAAAERLGLEVEILREDVGALVANERMRLAAAAAADRLAEAPGGGAAQAAGPAAGLGPAFFDDYRTLPEIDAFTSGLVTDHPGLVTRTNLGNSLEGRPIHVLSITGAGDPADKPSVVLNSMQHAREWIGPPTVLWFVDRLLDDYGTDPEVTALLDAIELHVIPVTNPDGYRFSYLEERFWRKNRRDNGDGTFGVDLNRNWGFEWGGAGSDGETSSLTYRGTAPFSEPETQRLRDFILGRGDVAAHIDVHSYSQLILWPFGYDFVEPEGIDRETHIDLGVAFADEIASVEGSVYSPQPGWALYLAAGIASDWAYGSAGALSYTFELRPATAGEGGFVLPPEQIVPTGIENAKAFRLLCREVAAGVRWNFPDGVPQFVDRTAPDAIRVAPLPVATADLDPATAVAALTVNGADAGSVPLALTADDGIYALTLPSGIACGSTVALSISVEAVDGRLYQYPAAGSGDTISVEIRDLVGIFADDSETDPGWVVTAVDLTGGGWERGVPAGNGDRQDPTVDADGSGAAWLTENAPNNTDVDGGPARLTSPNFELAGATDPILTSAQWMRNDDGDGDRLRTMLSDDGGATWVEASALAGGAPEWRTVAIRLLDHIALTDTVLVRFEVADNPNDSVTEAGIDAVDLTDFRCDPAGGPDVNNDGVVNFEDLVAVLAAWGPCPGCPEDVDGDGSVGLSDLIAVLAAFG